MSKLLDRIRTYFRISNVGPISRRYFVMNGFDGAMIILGIVIGAYVSGTTDAFWIVTAGLGASFAMGLSGFFGAYLTEEAEQSIKLKRLEKSMLKKLGKTVIGEASKFATFWAALVDGLSPFLTAMIGLSPFILSFFNIVSLEYAIYSSIIINLTVLFLLGVYLGKTSKKNIIICGLKMFFVGLFLTIVSFVFKIAA